MHILYSSRSFIIARIAMLFYERTLRVLRELR